ncbi:MAG: cupin domain-containing protein [Spirochaetes bacterium]|nr:MAG: cupin domain-containing protein [Spirochaetota bacterium]
MAEETRKRANLKEGTTVENPPGIFRTTLAFNDNIMLCHMDMKKGAKIPLHSHQAVQAGYIIIGKVKLFDKDGRSFVAEPGDSWSFESNEQHGAEIIEDSEVIECFSPMRPEYVD